MTSMTRPRLYAGFHYDVTLWNRPEFKQVAMKKHLFINAYI